MRPERLLAALADRPWPALASFRGCTVVAADPVETVVGEAAWDALGRPADPAAAGGAAAIAGGWIGLLAYDLAGGLERLPAPLPDPGGPPVAALARHDAVAIIDRDGRCTLASAGGRRPLAALARAVERSHGIRLPAAGTPPQGTAVESSLDAAAYRDAVERVRELIRAGDCYQVNLCQRLTAAWRESPLALARGLWAAAGPSSHRAFLGLPGGAVVSASPERLVRLDDGAAASEPIKGTAAAGASAALRASAKDRAEHVMIVDLVRNDLGRVARPGSVLVSRLMDPLPTAYVDHLVSEVRAELREGAGPRELLRAVFPGGSVTGCPKVRAMEVIRELEPVGRGPAYGSVVAVGRDGSLEASVAIRTAWAAGAEARYWCGGAVVWDSDPEAERREAWAKAAPFLQAIGAPAPG
ncbi:MAG: para-aminobenzoate synthetase component [Miltoncostaeaceae bacterium]|nr:para-aminobenzoate synthetase component [Miltoncostaeaceae bacterium]